MAAMSVLIFLAISLGLSPTTNAIRSGSRYTEHQQNQTFAHALTINSGRGIILA